MADATPTEPKNVSPTTTVNAATPDRAPRAGQTTRRGVRRALRRTPTWLASASFVATLTITWASWACPKCAVGRAARQQVWDEGFATNLLIALVPFVLVGMVSLWAEQIGKARSARR